MRIISKFKDYYDHLVGMYGVDPKLVMDRTSYYNLPYIPSDNTKVTLSVCDYEVEGLWVKGKVLYGEELIPHINKKYKNCERDEYEHYYIFLPGASLWNHIKILKKPTKRENSPNITYNCPILVWDGLRKEWLKHPILKEYQFYKVYPAKEIWLLLSEWLGKRLDSERPDNQTNKEKIISHGFDPKISFRNIKD